MRGLAKSAVIRKVARNVAMTRTFLRRSSTALSTRFSEDPLWTALSFADPAMLVAYVGTAAASRRVMLAQLIRDRLCEQCISATMHVPSADAIIMYIVISMLLEKRREKE